MLFLAFPLPSRCGLGNGRGIHTIRHFSVEKRKLGLSIAGLRLQRND